MSEAVILKRNGDLIHRYWHYNRRAKKGSYKERKIIFVSPSILHDKYCELEEGITLGEIFKFMNKNLEFWNLLIGNWCTEIVTEGLMAPPTKLDKDSTTKMSYLELYRTMEIAVHDKKPTIEGKDRVDFHGIGVHVKDDPQWGAKVGDKVNLAIDFSPANELAPYEVRFNSEYEIWFWDYDADVNVKRDDKENIILDEGNPRRLVPFAVHSKATLFQILYGIIWELSFFGGPKDRNKKTKAILKSAAKVTKSLKKKGKKKK